MTEFNNQMNLKIPEEITKPRFIEPSGLSREDAKKICEANGEVCGCN